ncbi:acetyl-CoA carboxylase biotin carboxylase subunit [Hoeflea sp. CAU 1731]
MTQTFDTLLVANRGEIALRIMRTARRMGLETIAVHSPADSAAPHVKFADRAVALEGSAAAESYLSIEQIIALSLESNAQAIHPGYGFLSENPDFAKACKDTGLIFVGPDEHAIRAMGSKAAAKALAEQAGIPCIPGFKGGDQSDDAFVRAAEEIGFPLMIKATAGGGGRGMRLVRNADALKGELDLARTEARAAFGSDELILERAMENVRHVEIQILADAHGHCIHLGERDCSVQRRHQKVLEEAPCPALTNELRQRMGKAAVDAARAVNYVGAGTVEFLLTESGDFYFLEMNTRLQVEHPVTEMVTGLDIVEWQIRIARGETLALRQEDIGFHGHAIEARLCAEDDAFMPSTGPIHFWRPPEGDGVRVDAGIEAGLEISPFYDSMIAKIIAHGPDRESARQALVTALDQTILFGPQTNKAFLKTLLTSDAFASGQATTDLVGQLAFEQDEADPDTTAIAAVLVYLDRRRQAHEKAVSVSPALLDWSSSPLLPVRIGLAEAPALRLTAKGNGCYAIEMDGATRTVQTDPSDPLQFVVDSKRLRLDAALIDGDAVFVALKGRELCFRRLDGLQSGSQDGAEAGLLRAPMHGVVTEIGVSIGDAVTKGQRLGVVEAMKMQHEIVAPIDGIVAAIGAETSRQIANGAMLFEINDN